MLIKIYFFGAVPLNMPKVIRHIHPKEKFELGDGAQTFYLGEPD